MHFDRRSLTAVTDLATRFREPEPPELAALRIQERAQTLRLGLCVIAAVLVVVCLIPIANGRPRLRRQQRETTSV